MANNNAMHAKPDLRVEFEPNDHFFRLGDPYRYAHLFMNTRENMCGGTSIILSANDTLDNVPDSHKDIITPEIRLAFDDPIAYFRAVANRCRFPKMRDWLNAVTETGKWQLMLEEGFMMDRCTQGGYFLWSESVAGAVVAPPIDLNPTHDIDAFAHYYSLVDIIHWDDFACAGGLFGFGAPCHIVDYGIESQAKSFPSDKTFVWGNSLCGDTLVYNSDGQLGFLSHETGTAYTLGTIDEGVNWVFDELLNGRTPEFDYKMA